MKLKYLMLALAMAALVAIGGVAFYRTGDSVASGDGHGHEEGGHGHEEGSHDEGAEGEHEEAARGPHGGKLLGDEEFALEATIYERGVEPQLRVYPYRDGKPLDPAQVRLVATVSRLDGTQVVNFRPEADYLLGDQVIYEPHSFDVALQAEAAGKSYRFAYSQEEGRLTLAEASLKSGGIEIATAGPRPIQSVLKLPGEVRIKHDQRVQVVPRMAGVVVSAPKSLGASIKKGEVLLTLESRELAELRSAYLTAQQRLELAEAAFQREAALWKQKVTSEQDYLSARKERAEAQIALEAAAQGLRSLGLNPARVAGTDKQGSLTRFEVRAPFDGVLLDRRVAVGQSVAADTPVFELANIEAMEAELAVYPDQQDKVRVGQRVILQALSGNLTAEGEVYSVSTVVGESNRAAVAHVAFPNPERRWREGQFVEGQIVREEVTVPVAVKVDAVQTFRDWQVVFARFGDAFEVRPVELGRSDGEWVEVVSGLKAGQPYAATNAFVLKAELGKAGASHDH